jgi:hypothetical protein
MRSMMRAAVLLAFSGLAACESSPPLDSTPAAQSPSFQAKAVDDASAPAGGPVNGDPPKALASDAGTEAETSSPAVVTPTEATTPTSCGELAAAGAPDTLVDFQWDFQVAPGPGSDVWDYVWIENGCQMRIQHQNAQRMVTMDAADCANTRAWVTNARFLDVLRTGSGCPYGDGNPTELFELIVTPEGRVARKTYACPEPTLEVLRACLHPVVDRLFPR